ncbi:hypothetical protein CSUB01_08361, partial [Colletotrichum sublineola]
MTRGNQRDKAREAAQKKAASVKKANNMSGTEMQRAKETAAEIMRQKQAADDRGLIAHAVVPPRTSAHARCRAPASLCVWSKGRERDESAMW